MRKGKNSITAIKRAQSPQ